MTHDLDALALAFMERQTMADTRSYVGSGRRFRRLSKADLYALWAAAFKDLCHGDRIRLRDVSYLGAEIELRNLQKPVELAREGLELARQRSKEAQKKNPELFKDLKDDIDEFLVASKATAVQSAD